MKNMRLILFVLAFVLILGVYPGKVVAKEKTAQTNSTYEQLYASLEEDRKIKIGSESFC